jgi:hypothetical protein
MKNAMTIGALVFVFSYLAGLGVNMFTGPFPPPPPPIRQTTTVFTTYSVWVANGSDKKLVRINGIYAVSFDRNLVLVQ